jgi:hypothetical protein
MSNQELRAARKYLATTEQELRDIIIKVIGPRSLTKVEHIIEQARNVENLEWGFIDLLMDKLLIPEDEDCRSKDENRIWERADQHARAIRRVRTAETAEIRSRKPATA